MITIILLLLLFSPPILLKPPAFMENLLYTRYCASVFTYACIISFNSKTNPIFLGIIISINRWETKK